MTEDDDLLLRKFFEEAGPQQIADDGFTERVMRQLEARGVTPVPVPSIVHRPEWSLATFNRLWTPFCVLVFAVLFVVFRGWELLAVHFEMLLRTFAMEPFSLSPLAFAAVLFSLLFVGVNEAVSRA